MIQFDKSFSNGLVPPRTDLPQKPVAILESGARNHRLDDDPSPKTGPPFRVFFFGSATKKHQKTAGENWEQIFGEWGVFLKQKKPSFKKQTKMATLHSIQRSSGDFQMSIESACEKPFLLEPFKRGLGTQ